MNFVYVPVLVIQNAKTKQPRWFLNALKLKNHYFGPFTNRYNQNGCQDSRVYIPTSEFCLSQKSFVSPSYQLECKLLNLLWVLTSLSAQSTIKITKIK